METYSSKISENGGDELMSSRQVSLVNRSVAPESEMERKMTATSGRRCFVSSAKLDPLGLLVKTLVESSRWYSPARRLKWEVTRTFAERITRFTRNDNGSLLSKSDSTSHQSDIQSNQLLSRLVPSELPTGETGCGFWQEGMMLPTPMAHDYRRRGPNSEQQGLPEMAYKDLLPTPRAMEVIEHPEQQAKRLKDRTGKKLNNLSSGAKFGLLPTPQSRDFKNGSTMESKRGQRKREQGRTDALCNIPVIIGKHAKQTGGKTSQLNPLFVTEMMGFPLDYLVSPFQDGDKNR